MKKLIQFCIVGFGCLMLFCVGVVPAKANFQYVDLNIDGSYQCAKTCRYCNGIGCYYMCRSTSHPNHKNDMSDVLCLITGEITETTLETCQMCFQFNGNELYISLNRPASNVVNFTFLFNNLYTVTVSYFRNFTMLSEDTFITNYQPNTVHNGSFSGVGYYQVTIQGSSTNIFMEFTVEL